MAARVAAGGWEDHKVAEPSDVLPEPVDNVGGVEIYFVGDVLDGIFGADMGPMIPYAETGRAVQAWADAHGAITYAEPKEDFDLGEAARQALEAGVTKAVVDNLS